MKDETPSQNGPANQISSNDPQHPTTSSSADGSFSIVSSSFQAVNSSPVAGGSRKRSASEAKQSGAGPYSPTSPSSGTTARTPTNFSQITSSPSQPKIEMNTANGDQCVRSSQEGFNGLYFQPTSPTYSNYDDSHPLSQLRIPEDSYVSGLSHTQDNSPWCSSASDSTYSTQSEGSLNCRLWALRVRTPFKTSTATSDWTGIVGASYWASHPIVTATQEMRSPPAFDAMLEHYETPYSSPRMTPPTSTPQLLDVPNTFGTHYMDSVGTPALPTYNKSMSQFLLACPLQLSDPELASMDGQKDMVEQQSLGSLGTMTMSLPISYQTQLAQLDSYIISYWQSFDYKLPIIHRGTFDATEDRLLSSAMAALGTQYKNSPEARQRGVELNDYCRKSIGLVSCHDSFTCYQY